MSTDTFRRSDDPFGHPRGLFVCFATEMWERFSFYGMKYLLVLYLDHHLFSDGDALRILVPTARWFTQCLCLVALFPIATWVKRDLSN